jgi:hypothetical protein
MNPGLDKGFREGTLLKNTFRFGFLARYRRAKIGLS